MLVTADCARCVATSHCGTCAMASDCGTRVTASYCTRCVVTSHCTRCVCARCVVLVLGCTTPDTMDVLNTHVIWSYINEANVYHKKTTK